MKLAKITSNASNHLLVTTIHPEFFVGTYHAVCIYKWKKKIIRANADYTSE